MNKNVFSQWDTDSERCLSAGTADPDQNTGMWSRQGRGGAYCLLSCSDWCASSLHNWPVIYLNGVWLKPLPLPESAASNVAPYAESWTNLFIRQAAHESESVSVYILLKLMVFFIHSLDRDVSKSFHKPALLTFSPQGARYAMYEFRLGTVLSSFRRSSITDLWSSSAEYFYIRSQISQIPKRRKMFKFLSFFITIFGNVLYFARI